MNGQKGLRFIVLLAFSMNLDDSALSLFSLGVVSEVYPTALPFMETSVILA